MNGSTMEKYSAITQGNFPDIFLRYASWDIWAESPRFHDPSLEGILLLVLFGYQSIFMCKNLDLEISVGFNIVAPFMVCATHPASTRRGTDVAFMLVGHVEITW